MVDSEQVHHRALVDALRGWGIEAPDDLQRELIGLAMADTFARVRGRFARLPDYDEFVAAKSRAYLARAKDLKMRPGAAAAFDWLSRRRTPQALVSNSARALLDANLRAVGLFEADLITVSRDDVDRGKPDPEPYLRAAERLRIPPGECLVIEDSPPGVASGLAAGMTVLAWPEPDRCDLAFPPGATLAPPDALISRVRDLFAG
nr:HAD family phosphatase [Roseiarcus fermentans]